MKTKTEDKRPDPKPRKLPHLWQAYLMWDELVQLRKRHLLRTSSIEAGKSAMDSDMERLWLEATNIDKLIETYKKQMIGFGKAVPVWDWMTTIKGLKEGSLAAQLLAQIDDIGLCSNVSKLWRFAGYAVIDGKREYRTAGEVAHYNARLKSIVYLIVDQFIRQQTPPYVDIYYAEKTRLREEHPEPLKVDGKQMYNDGHLHAMAMRKTGKIFLQHLWLKWREAEGLPTNAPYVAAQLGHADIIPPLEV